MAYALFSGRNFAPFRDFLSSLSYMGNFLAGMFYAYGFTAAPATAIFLSLAKDGNLLIAGLIGGIGALLGDLIIFFFIRYSFGDEIKRISKEKLTKAIATIEKRVFGRYQKYFVMTFAGFLIASPLPTEIGVTLLASSKTVSIKKFMIIAYTLHTLGIFAILLVGRAI